MNLLPSLPSKYQVYILPFSLYPVSLYIYTLSPKAHSRAWTFMRIILYITTHRTILYIHFFLQVCHFSTTHTQSSPLFRVHMTQSIFLYIEIKFLWKLWHIYYIENTQNCKIYFIARGLVLSLLYFVSI